LFTSKIDWSETTLSAAEIAGQIMITRLTEGAGGNVHFSQIAFKFAVTPQLMGKALFWALVMGLVGGMLPAIRAARLPVVTALREL